MTDPSQSTRRRPAWLIPIAVVIAFLAAAGLAAYLLLGDGPSGGGGLGASTPRVADVASEAGCTSLTPDDQLELYVREGGVCRIGADRLHIITFAGTQQRDDYLRIAQSFGGVYVVGDRFLISVESIDLANSLASKLDARIA